MSEVQEIDGATLQQWLVDGVSCLLVDVRSAGELAQGALAGSEHIPLHTVPLRVAEIEQHSGPVVVYCRTGARSAQACAFMNARGCRAVYNLRGGIVRWAQEGRPVERPPRSAAG